MRRPDRVEIGVIAVVALFVLYFVIALPRPSTVALSYAVLNAIGRVDQRCSVALAETSLRNDQQLWATWRSTQAEKQHDPSGLIQWKTAHGSVWATSSTPKHIAGVRNPAARARWEAIDGTSELTIRRGDVLIDGGGHMGESALRALQLGASLVVTVEPDPDNVRALRRNLASDIAADRVKVIEKGVYDRIGTLTFSKSRWHSATGAFHPDGDGHSLPITTIDAIVRELQLPRVDLIKLDIEGSEVPALTGAAETLRRFKPRIAVGTYHEPGDLEGVEQTVRSIRPDYQVASSRCLISDMRLFPHLLYFY